MELVVYQYNIILLFITYVISSPLIALIVKSGSKNKKWGDFWLIWFFSMILPISILALSLIDPSVIGNLFENIFTFFK